MGKPGLFRVLAATAAAAAVGGGATAVIESGGGTAGRRQNPAANPPAKILEPASGATAETTPLGRSSIFGAKLLGSATAPFSARTTPKPSARRIHLRSSKISVEFNSYVIGNVPPTSPGKLWTGVLQGQRVFSRGPGNLKGAYYQYAYIFGPKKTGFNGCGWLQEGRWTGRSTLVKALCSRRYPPQDPRFHAWFRRTFTDGHVMGGAGDGAWAQLDFNAPGCTRKLAFYNARPWLRHEQGLIGFPLRTTAGRLRVKVRYVSKSGQYVMTHVPAWSTPTTNWPFVSKKCFDGYVRKL